MPSLCSEYRLRENDRRFTGDTHCRSENQRGRRHPGVRASGMLVTTPLIQALPALVGADYVPTTALGSVDGMTENQQRTGDAVQITCVGLSGLDGRTELQEDLFENCSSMVQNAFELDDATPTPLSLGLDAEGLASAVQTVATEELAATKSMAT